MPAPVLTAQQSVRKNGPSTLGGAMRPALGAVFLALMLAGCAKQNAPGYYNTEHDSTLSDARQQAQGRNAARAPSQIQLGFGDTEQKKKATGEATPAEAAGPTVAMPVVRPLLEAKTFLGTVPCLTGESACSAARVTLTLAPSGEWRSRTEGLGTSGKQAPALEQGCWSLTGTDPWRILLKSKNNVRTASLTFLNDNVLRINAINDNKPALDYHLTRQADVDGIAEMDKHAALKCQG